MPRPVKRILLSDLQLRVLRWVADGCPENVFDGYDHRISAAALRSRDLITITGRGPTWRASITPTGKAHLQRGSEATRPPRPPNSAEPRESQTKKATRPPRRLSPTDQLIADLLAAGGAIRVPSWRKSGEPDYQQRVLAAKRFGKVPLGKRLEMNWHGAETETRLVDAIPGTSVPTSPVPVPRRITCLHPVARHFRDQTDRHEVSRARLGRCVRIVHALATEAERRGFEVETSSPSQKYGGEVWSGATDGHLLISVGGHSYRLRVFEEKVRTRGPWESERTRLLAAPYGNIYGGNRLRRYDAAATGRLVITIDAASSRDGRPASFADRKSWALEDKLPDLLRELVVRAAEDDHREEEEQRRAEERRREWEETMERARERFLEAYRAELLHGQAADWEQARRARNYLSALEEAHGQSEEARPWIEWIRGYLVRSDPLQKVQMLPHREEISPEELKPFLDGLSPYGPSRW